jgi:2,5-furandicarboxylate decarboxylase 1
MTFNDLKSFVDFLEEHGELIRIEEVLDSKFEVSAAIRHGAKVTDKAILVERVKDYDCPVVGNLLGTRRRMGMALGVGEEDLVSKLLVKEKDLIPSKTVDKGPVKEIIIRDDIDLLKTLPVLTYHEGDASPYITQGIVFMKDRETGIETMGVHRLQVKGRNRLGGFFTGKTSSEIIRNTEKRGEALEIAVAIGVDPSTLLASVIWAPFANKFAIAGALRGSPLDLVQAETVDLKIPAQAMFVLEGKLIPGLRETEGPFGESNGYYVTAENPIIEINVITHQKNPIYSVFVPWDKEDGTMLDLFATPHIHKSVKSVLPSLVDIKLFFTAGFAVVSIKKRYENEPRELLYFLLSTVPFIKIAMVVDEDVDLESQKEINWAMGTRCFPDKDVILMESVTGSPLDPTAKGKDFVVSKLGLDATKPLDKINDFRKIKPPPEVQQKIITLFEKYLGDL